MRQGANHAPAMFVGASNCSLALALSLSLARAQAGCFGDIGSPKLVRCREAGDG